MRGTTQWQARPYQPQDDRLNKGKPYICRLAPYEYHVEIEWLDTDPAPHSLRYRRHGTLEAWRELAAEDTRVTVEGLETDSEYEFQILRKGETPAKSAVRPVRTGWVPGRVVNYLHPQDMQYAFSGRALCSPCLVKLPSGALLASMDLYTNGGPQNLTLLFRSDDRGKTWRYLCDLFPCYWATLFMHKGRLYVQGCSTEYGDILIGVSEDEGASFSKPVALFYGSCSNLASGWQRTPMPMIYKEGRLYVGVDYGAWQTGGHCVGVLSIDENADLLQPENWRCSELVAFDPAWPGAPKGDNRGMLEGNVVIATDGGLKCLYRIDLKGCQPDHGIAVAMAVNPYSPEAPLAFEGFVALPSGSNSKTHLLQDPLTGWYIAIGNICVDEKTPTQRNVLALQCSRDLKSFQVIKYLLDSRKESPAEVGYQYIHFIIDGEDILYLSRTARNGARNYHDANYQTFHTIENFRQLLPDAHKENAGPDPV